MPHQHQRLQQHLADLGLLFPPVLRGEVLQIHGKFWNGTNPSGNLGIFRKFPKNPKKPLEKPLTLHLLLRELLGAGQRQQQQRERVQLGAQQPLVVLWEFRRNSLGILRESRPDIWEEPPGGAGMGPRWFPPQNLGLFPPISALLPPYPGSTLPEFWESLGSPVPRPQGWEFQPGIP